MKTATLRDELGFMRSVAILWLVVLAALAVAGFDAGSIAFSQYKVTNAASDAALEAATVFKQTGDRNQAYKAAAQSVKKDAPDSMIPDKDGFSIDPRTGKATVVVVKRASTLIAGRIGFLDSLVRSKAKETSGPRTM
jgi:Flp pilus assembly protein TadG